MKTDKEKADLVRTYEDHANGTEKWHRHWTGRLHYTDGIKFLAETAGAFWLIDLVASHLSSILKKHGDAAHFAVWRVRVPAGGGGIVNAWSDTPESEAGEDGPGAVRFVEQKIPFTDFPRELAPFEFYVENGVMLLKGER